MSGLHRPCWRGALLLAMLAIALLAGCAAPSLPPLPWQAHSPAPLPAAQQIVHVAMRSGYDLSDLFDPSDASHDIGGDQIAALLYSGLFTIDASQRPVPALAASYSVSADGLRYTFHLRPDARFAEGTPLTSADVAFSLNRAMSGCGRSAARWDFFDVKDQPDFAQACDGQGADGLRAVTTLIGDALLTPDPQTVVIVLSRPDGALIAKLAMPYSFIVEQSFVTRYGDQWTTRLTAGGQGTSGMYSIAMWAPWGAPGIAGSGRTPASLTLRAARGYWGQQPMLRQVIIALRSQQSNCAPAQNTASCVFYALQPTDQIVLSTWPLGLYALQVNARGLRFSSTPGDTVDVLTLDSRIPPLDDVRVRQALALALDKHLLAKADLGTATTHLVPPGVGAYPAELSGPFATAPLGGNVARAQALWQRYVADKCSGVASRCPTITTFDDGQPATYPVGAAVLARWRATLPGIRFAPVVYSGLLLTTEPAPPAVNLDFSWEDYPDPQDWLRMVTYVAGDPLVDPSSPPPFIYDARAAALVARAEATLDSTARLALYQQAENTLLNDAVVIPIAQEQDGWAIKSTVANFPANPEPYIAPSAWARIYLTAPDQ